MDGAQDGAQDVLIVRQLLGSVLGAAKQERRGRAPVQSGRGGSFAISTGSWQGNARGREPSRELTRGKRSAEELKAPCTSLELGKEVTPPASPHEQHPGEMLLSALGKGHPGMALQRFPRAGAGSRKHFLENSGVTQPTVKT